MTSNFNPSDHKTRTRFQHTRSRSNLFDRQSANLLSKFLECIEADRVETETANDINSGEDINLLRTTLTRMLSVVKKDVLQPDLLLDNQVSKIMSKFHTKLSEFEVNEAENELKNDLYAILGMSNNCDTKNSSQKGTITDISKKYFASTVLPISRLSFAQKRLEMRRNHLKFANSSVMCEIAAQFVAPNMKQDSVKELVNLWTRVCNMEKDYARVYESVDYTIASHWVFLQTGIKLQLSDRYDHEGTHLPWVNDVPEMTVNYNEFENSFGAEETTLNNHKQRIEEIYCGNDTPEEYIKSK